MFQILLNKQEKIRYDILQQAQTDTFISFSTLSQRLALSPRMLARQLSAWQAQPMDNCLQSLVDLKNKQLCLPTSFAQQLDLYVSILQRNAHLRLCWHLIEQPYCRLSDLEEIFYFSVSTIQRQTTTLAKFLTPYHIQLSFNHDPIIKGCEFQIRWLAWCLSLIFDPPFDWFSREELLQRFIEVQQMRITNGHSLNQTLPEKLVFSPDFSYQMSENGWQYLGKQLLDFELPITTLESSSIFLFFQCQLDFFKTYQKQLLASPSP